MFAQPSVCLQKLVLLVILLFAQNVFLNAAPSSDSSEEEKVVSLKSEILCDDGKECYFQDDQCDGTPNCDDQSDEKRSLCNAPDYTCPEGKWKCETGGLCIDDRKVCDKSPQCPDKSDESNVTCATRTDWCTSSPMWVRCNGVGSCVAVVWLCDGKNNCDDGWDEQNCTKPCGHNGYLCADGKQCINQYAVCDGKRDCVDNSDEDKTFCENRVCPEGFFTCKSANGQCVQQSLVCDKAEDCRDGSDELCESVVYTILQWGNSIFGL